MACSLVWYPIVIWTEFLFGVQVSLPQNNSQWRGTV